MVLSYAGIRMHYTVFNGQSASALACTTEMYYFILIIHFRTYLLTREKFIKKLLLLFSSGLDLLENRLVTEKLASYSYDFKVIS